MKNATEKNTNIIKAKKELAFLNKSQRAGRLTEAGVSRLQKLEGYLIANGVYDF